MTKAETKAHINAVSAYLAKYKEPLKADSSGTVPETVNASR
jgi:hypothetical protein